VALEALLVAEIIVTVTDSQPPPLRLREDERRAAPLLSSQLYLR
jgi:hypothetical protein